MKTIAILLAFVTLPVLASATPNDNDHLKLNSAVNAKEVKTYQAQKSVVLLPGFAAQPGAIFEASVGNASPQSVVTVGKNGEELVRPIRIESTNKSADLKTEMGVNKP